MSNETPFLHGLADDLGVPARYARHAFLTAIAASFSMATVDKVALIYPSAVGVAAIDPATPGVPHPTEITTGTAGTLLQDGISIAPGEEVTILCDDDGMFLESNDESCPGFDYAVAAAGSDDDPMLVLTIEGVMEDSIPLKHTLKGDGTVPLPLRAVSSSLVLKVRNPQPGGGQYVQLTIQATARVAKSGVTERGREGMRAAGIPVGKAKMSIFAKSAEIAQTIVNGQVAEAKGVRGAAQTAGKVLSRVLASPALPLAKKLFGGLPRATNPTQRVRAGGLFLGLKPRRRR